MKKRIFQIACLVTLALLPIEAFAGSGWLIDKAVPLNSNKSLCLDAKQPDTIVSNCTKYLDSAPADQKKAVLTKIVVARLQLGHLGDALIWLNNAVEQLPPDGNILVLRCWTQGVLRQNFDQALLDCNAVLKPYPKSVSALDARGLVYFQMGKYDVAISDLNAALEISPNLTTSLYVRGLTRLKINDLDGGQADIAAAKKLDPDIEQQYAGYGIKP